MMEKKKQLAVPKITSERNLNSKNKKNSHLKLTAAVGEAVGLKVGELVGYRRKEGKKRTNQT